MTETSGAGRCQPRLLPTKAHPSRGGAAKPGVSPRQPSRRRSRFDALSRSHVRPHGPAPGASRPRDRPARVRGSGPLRRRTGAVDGGAGLRGREGVRRPQGPCEAQGSPAPPRVAPLPPPRPRSAHGARGQPGAGASPPGIRGRPPQGPPPQGMPEALQAGCAQAPQRSLRLHPRAEPADRLVPFYGRRLPRLEGLRRLRLRGGHEHGDRAPARGARREHPGS